MITKHCLNCTKEFKTQPYRIKDGRGKYCNRFCYTKSQTGEKSPNWKGDYANYGNKHKWLTEYYGQPKECEVCGLNDPKRKYHWANLTGKYLRNRSDYKRMCVSCHRKYDYGDFCKRGHNYIENNVYVNKLGARVCKICRMKWVNEKYGVNWHWA